ncbi:MAG: alpha/beta fold hydrolase [Planctomycetota bacterium]
MDNCYGDSSASSPRRVAAPLYAACVLNGILCLPLPLAAADVLGWKIELLETPAAVNEAAGNGAAGNGAAVPATVAQPRYRLLAPSDSPPHRVVLVGTRTECEQRRLDELRRIHGTGFANLRVPTFGGKQFWADEFVFAGWRIQRGVLTGHYRLLDDRDVRHAWGSYESCRVTFEEQRLHRQLRHRSEHVVVLLHGLVRSKDCMSKLESDLEGAGYATVAVNYPSTRAPLAEHAAQVAQVLDRLGGAKQVSFVVHSLGGLVVRTLLARQGDAWRERMQVQRVVMLAPPSNGSAIADVLAPQGWFEPLLGAAAAATTAETAGLPVPSCEFAVIAGGTGSTIGKNPLLSGDNDGLLRVATTRLPGGAFLRVNARHRKILDDPRARAATLRFLASGVLEAPAASSVADGAPSEGRQTEDTAPETESQRRVKL